jgi:NTP pyrophosphatase (non-canonical NTP hydrolase)
MPTPQDYRDWVAKMHSPERDDEGQMVNAALGMAGEAGEIANKIKKMVFYNMNISSADLMEECGDVMFYMQWLIERINPNLTLEDVMRNNMLKLNARYPGGWAAGGGNR